MRQWLDSRQAARRPACAFSFVLRKKLADGAASVGVHMLICKDVVAPHPVTLVHPTLSRAVVPLTMVAFVLVSVEQLCVNVTQRSTHLDTAALHSGSRSRSLFCREESKVAPAGTCHGLRRRNGF